MTKVLDYSKTYGGEAQNLKTTELIADTATINGSSVVALGTITSASANALTVGRQGTTNPAFNVDASTAVSVTGLNVKAGALAGGLAVSVISSGANENLTVNAKGSGTIGIGSVSTGVVTITPATVVTGSLTCTTGVQTTAVSLTATADGLTTGIIPAGTSFVSVTSDANTKSVTLPTPVLGNSLKIKEVGTVGYNVLPQAGTQYINGTLADAGKKLACAGNTGIAVFTCVVGGANGKWIQYRIDDDGTLDSGGTPS